jgi:KaiC/GvpD/RAD55 family RecA-like ATPase
MARKIEFDSDDIDFFGDSGSIGSVKLDKMMNGGIPRGFTVLCIGEPGAGMDLFMKQFASVAEDPENTILLSTAESENEILTVYRRFKWPLDLMVRTLGEEFNEAVLEKDLEASRFRLEGFSMQDIQRLAQTRFVEENSTDYLIEMTNQVTRLGPFFRCAVDNLDFFFQRNESSRVISMVRVMQAHAQLNRGLLALSVSSGTVSPSIEREMSLISDIVFEFEVKQIGNSFETRMIIRKFRNSPENLRVYTYRVTPEEGITPETVDRVV